MLDPRILEQIRERLPEITEIRRDLHRHPELRFQETRTANVVKSVLERAGIEVKTGVAKTGVIGTLKGSAKGSNRTIALRADMDALPLQEKTGKPYASENAGIHHACGHDGHVATLLGTACALAAAKDRIPGVVRFIFQPAEEGGAGGLKMCEEGALADPPAGMVFALHSWPFLDVGKIGLRKGTIMASTDSFRIRVLGRGGHGAYPHKCVDPIVIGAKIVDNIQAIVSRERNPVDPVVVTIGKFHAGTAINVIPDDAEMEGTIRTLSEETRRATHEGIRRVAESTAAAYRAKVAFELFEGYPSTVNHDVAVDLLDQVGREVLGEQGVTWLPTASMGGEDFAYYLQRVPGAMFRLGVGADRPALHSSDFDFDDGALEIGMKIFSGLVMQYLSEGR